MSTDDNNNNKRLRSEPSYLKELNPKRCRFFKDFSKNRHENTENFVDLPSEILREGPDLPLYLNYDSLWALSVTSKATRNALLTRMETSEKLKSSFYYYEEYVAQVIKQAKAWMVYKNMKYNLASFGIKYLNWTKPMTKNTSLVMGDPSLWKRTRGKRLCGLEGAFFSDNTNVLERIFCTSLYDFYHYNDGKTNHPSLRLLIEIHSTIVSSSHNESNMVAAVILGDNNWFLRYLMYHAPEENRFVPSGRERNLAERACMFKEAGAFRRIGKCFEEMLHYVDPDYVDEDDSRHYYCNREGYYKIKP